MVNNKWLATLTESIQNEVRHVSQALVTRVRQLAERYATPLPTLIAETEQLSARVDMHLKRMGFGNV
jgi:type I restriction enzyme M protein